MDIAIIKTGKIANDGTGDSPRDAWIKQNTNNTALKAGIVDAAEAVAAVLDTASAARTAAQSATAAAEAASVLADRALARTNAVTTRLAVAAVPIPANTVVVDAGNGACAPADTTNAVHRGKVLGFVKAATPTGALAMIRTIGLIEGVAGAWSDADALYVGAAGTLVTRADLPSGAKWRQQAATATAGGIAYLPGQAGALPSAGAPIDATARIYADSPSGAALLDAPSVVTAGLATAQVTETGGTAKSVPDAFAGKAASTYAVPGSAVAVPAYNRLKDHRFLTEFACADGGLALANPSGTRNQTKAFTTAVANCSKLFVPSGVFASDPFEVPYGVEIECVPGITLLRARQQGDFINLGGYAKIRGAQFWPASGNTPQTAGYYVVMHGDNATLDDCKMFFGYQGVDWNANLLTIDRLYTREFNGGRYVIDVTGNGVFGKILNWDAVHDVMNMPQANLRLGGSGDITISANLVNAKANCLVNPGSGFEVDSVDFVGFLDTGGTGLLARPTGTGRFQRSSFAGWIGGHGTSRGGVATGGFATGNGVDMDTTQGGFIDGISFRPYLGILGNTNNGAQVAGPNTTRTTIAASDGAIAGSGGTGVAVLNQASKTKIGGDLFIGPWGGFGPNGRALFTDTNAGEVTVDQGVDMRGNTAGSIIGNGSLYRSRSTDT